jgi:drug/metabolite transporter (DMT)-like permease
MEEARRAYGLVDLAMLGLVVVWGANFAVVKWALSEIAPFAYNALRFTGASVVTFALTWLVERDLSVQRKDWSRVVLLGLLSNFAYQVLFIQGIARTRASNSSLVLSATPIFVALITTALGSERLSFRNWVGISVSFVGIYVLITGGGSRIGIGRETLAGDLLVLAAAAVWALYTALAKGLVVRNSVLRVTAWMMMTGTPLLVLMALPEMLRQDWASVSIQSWLGLAYSALLAIGVGYVVWNTGVKRLGSARAALYNYLPPLVAIVVSWVLLGETMTPLQALGGAGILVGVALGRQRRAG